jgi:hypothetical protein
MPMNDDFLRYCLEDLINFNSSDFIPLEEFFSKLKNILKLPDETIKALIRQMRNDGYIRLELGVKKENTTMPGGNAKLNVAINKGDGSNV